MTDEQILVTALSIASTLSVGLSVDPAAGAGRLARGPFAAVLALNVLALPIVAWVLHGTLGLGLAGAGLLVAAAAPGGSTGPLLAVVAGGDAATAARLFASATVVGTAGALVATLAFEGTGIAGLARAGVFVTAASLVPLVLGLVLRARRPAEAQWLAPKLSRFSLVLLVVTVGGLAYRHGSQATAADLAVASVIVAVSFGPAILVHGRARRLAVAQVSATRNLTLALLVLAALDTGPRATIAVLGYGLVMYIATGAVAVVARWRAAARLRAAGERASA
jgi:BASS family bile acid:Na+ symporter